VNVYAERIIQAVIMRISCNSSINSSSNNCSINNSSISNYPSRSTTKTISECFRLLNTATNNFRSRIVRSVPHPLSKLSCKTIFLKIPRSLPCQLFKSKKWFNPQQLQLNKQLRSQRQHHKLYRIMPLPIQG
jgi:hypothetical protein